MRLIERLCRNKSARHYAERFVKPETDRHVMINVDANWPDKQPIIDRVLADLVKLGFRVDRNHQVE